VPDGIHIYRSVLRDDRGVHVLLGRHDRIGRIDRTAGLIALSLLTRGDGQETENGKRFKPHHSSWSAFWFSTASILPGPAG
jgi:hypothetical protein